MIDKYNAMFDMMESSDYSKNTDAELQALLKHHEEDIKELEGDEKSVCAKGAKHDIDGIKAEIAKRK